MDDLDVIVVGGYFGSGHRSNLLSHFLCAVAVKPEADDEHPTEFHTFCKVNIPSVTCVFAVTSLPL